jgi:peroxiredoxin (alkyl hydroperoxide reductase subunit C)
MLRLIDALDFHNKHGEVCPAGWTEGKDGMKPSHDGMKKYVSENADKL